MIIKEKSSFWEKDVQVGCDRLGRGSVDIELEKEEYEYGEEIHHFSHVTSISPFRMDFLTTNY